MWFRTQDGTLVTERGVMIAKGNKTTDTGATGRVLFFQAYDDVDGLSMFEGSHEDCDSLMSDMWRAICAHKDHFDVLRDFTDLSGQEAKP